MCAEICVTLIYILSICEARKSQNSLPQRGVTLDKELLLPLVRPNSKTTGSGPRVCKKCVDRANCWPEYPVLRWLPEVWPTVLTLESCPLSGLSWLRYEKQQFSINLCFVWWWDGVCKIYGLPFLFIHSIPGAAQVAKGWPHSASWLLARDWGQGRPLPPASRTHQRAPI